jgi:putative membrane protein
MFRFGFGHDFFWGMIPLLGTLLWIALLILLVWALIRWLTMRNAPFMGYHPMPPLSQPSALEILQLRYARGEIDDVTYQQMRERLELSMPPGQQQHQ